MGAQQQTIGGRRTAMKFLVTVDRDEDGVWVAECPAIPGCVSQGGTSEEAAESIREAIALCLEVRAERASSHHRDSADRSGHLDATQGHSAIADSRRQRDRRGVPRSQLVSQSAGHRAGPTESLPPTAQDERSPGNSIYEDDAPRRRQRGVSATASSPPAPRSSAPARSRRPSIRTRRSVPSAPSGASRARKWSWATCSWCLSRTRCCTYSRCKSSQTRRSCRRSSGS